VRTPKGEDADAWMEQKIAEENERLHLEEEETKNNRRQRAMSLPPGKRRD
jgi:hypothetical protein